MDSHIMPTEEAEKKAAAQSDMWNQESNIGANNLEDNEIVIDDDDDGDRLMSI